MEKTEIHSFLFIIGLNGLKATPWTQNLEGSNLVVESSTLSGGASIWTDRATFPAMRSAEYTEILQLLLARLERVSVDSYWAHRASGVRGSLLRALERLEADDAVSGPQLDAILDQGFAILERAARDRAH